MRRVNVVCGSFVALLGGVALLAVTATPDAIADAPPGRYVIDATTSTVRDTKTGLTWLRDPITPSPNTLETARKSCPAGFRLPDIKELATLVDETDTATSPYVDKTAFPALGPDGLWSDTQSVASATDYQSFVLSADGTTKTVYYNGCCDTPKMLCVQP